MNLIREAMARRAQGGVPAGGTAPPAAQQVALTPGSPMPQPQMPVPAGPVLQVPPQQQVPQQPQPQQGAPKPQGPNFDDETKALSKALIARLLKAI